MLKNTRVAGTATKPELDHTEPLMVPKPFVKYDLNDIAAEVHEANRKWWLDIETGEPIDRNVGELLMLIVSEVAEAMEGARKNLKDSHLPHRDSLEVELVDAMIRIFDFAGGMGLDLQGAFNEKMAYNAQRIDHTHAHRLGENGKKF